MTARFKNIEIVFTFILALALGLVSNSFHLLGNNLSWLPGDLGDGRLVNYFLEHCYLFFTGQIQSFWDAPFMFPHKSTLTFSENLLGTAPLYSLFRVFSLDRISAFQFWVIFMSVFNFTAAYYFLNYVFKNPYAAAFGAFIFAFSIGLQTEIVNPQLLPRFAIPLLFLSLYRLHESKNIKYLNFALFWLTYQLYCVIYLGFLLFIAFAVYFIVILTLEKKFLKNLFNTRKAKYQFIVSLVITVVCTLLLMIPYYIQSLNGAGNSYSSIRSSIPTLKSYFFSPLGSFSWKILGVTAIEYPSFWIHSIFAGGFATFAYVVFLSIWLGKKYKIAAFKNVVWNSSYTALAISSLIYLAFFTRFGDFSLYRIIYEIPGFSALRNLCRMISVQLVFYAFAAAYVFNLFFAKSQVKKLVLFLLLLPLLTLDNYTQDLFWYRTLKKDVVQRENKLLLKVDSLPRNSVFSYEPDSLITYNYSYHIDAMIIAQEKKLICVNGYSGYIPKAFDNFAKNVDSSGRKEYLLFTNSNAKSIYIIK